MRDFGTGGTGEQVVSRERLRSVQTLSLDQASAADRPASQRQPLLVEPFNRPITQPVGDPPVAVATGPATGPTTGPTTGLTDLPASLPTTGPTTGPVVAPATAPSAAPPQVMLTIEDVRQVALENNLDLKVELLNPTIARLAITEEQARFEALFIANANYGITDSPTSTTLEGSQSKGLQTSAGISVPLQTGGTIGVNVPISRSETNNVFSTLNPAYTADVALSITHPLLRGAGFDRNAQGIRVAFYQYQRTQAQTKLQVIRVLADVDRVYWRLYAARELLKLRIAEHELAVQQLRTARNLVRAGKSAEVEIVRAESGVADVLESIINAENAVRDRQRDLKRLLNKPGLEMASPDIVVPVTEPVAVEYRLNAEALAESAMAGRMELLELELQIAQETANIQNARNDTLPLVTLDYTYGIGGLGPELGDAFTQVREKRFEDHRLGLRIEVPIGNQAAMARLRRAMLSRMQSLASHDLRAQQIRQEVYNATDQLEANWQRILASRQRVVLAARLVEAERRQFLIGLRTSTEYLDAVTSLANARVSEIAAVADYQIAQVDIAFATGTVLGASNVVWQPITAPDQAMRR